MLDERQLRIDTFTNGGSEIAMRITHIENGLSVSGNGKSQIRLKNRLMKELKEKLEEKTGSLIIDGTALQGKPFYCPKEIKL